MKVQTITDYAGCVEKTLYFNNELIQGRKSTNGELKLDYFRQIVKVFDHVESFNHICLLGLGGGCLHSWLLKKYPHILIDTVEINPDVIGIAYTEFGLENDKRLHIIQQDAKKFIQQKRNYDIVIVDVYDEYGEVLLDDRWLRHTGKVIVYNSLINKDTYNGHIGRLRSIYTKVIEPDNQKLLTVDYNYITFCFNE